MIDLNPLRFALQYKPPSIFVEYEKNGNQIYTKKIKIKNLDRLKDQMDVNTMSQQLRERYPELLGPDKVEEIQISGLLTKLLSGYTKADSSSSSSSSTVMFEPKAAISPAGSPTEFKAGKVDMNEFVKSIDLNRCSDEMNAKAKAHMSQDFEANRLKPGDEGYVWDKQVDFEPAAEPTDWDDDEDSDF